MGGPMIPKEWEKGCGIAIFVAIGVFSLVVLSVWALLIVGVLKVLPFLGVLDPPKAFLVFALSLAILCAVLWAGAQVNVLRISESTQTRIWVTLVAAVLGAVVSGIVKALK